MGQTRKDQFWSPYAAPSIDGDIKNITFHPFFQGFEDDGWVKPEGGPIAADCGQDNSSGDQ